ncbi:MAG: UDP-N-acetylmuramoyl-L-alanyl-D-glutamate--2,6-diaminopimelate ligase, partial [Acinetobacter parvus]
MSISFQQIHQISIDAAWYTQPFKGFCLDSRKVASGQIFIALNSYSQPEKTIEFAQKALDSG